MEMSRQAVLKKVRNGGFQVSRIRSVGGRNGEAYLIPITSLPREAQLRYAAMTDRTDNGQADLAGYRERFGEEGVGRLMERLEAVREMKLFRESGTGSLCEKRAEVAARLGVSVSSLYNYEKAYAKQGLSGIMDTTQRKDKGAPRTLCRMAQDFVHSETCLSTRPQNRAIYSHLQRVAERLGGDACAVCPYNEVSLYRAQLIRAGRMERAEAPCGRPKDGLVIPRHYSTVDRFIASIPASVKALGRYGSRYWEARYMPKALRARPEMTNEVWFGDHHVFDVFVQGPDGKPVRPWLTAWMDARSGCLVGWALSLNPNSDTIVESLTHAIGHTKGSPFAGAPLMIYIDNGKDYRCRRMEGSALREWSAGQLNVSLDMDNALLHTLGIGVVHAIPYRAWSKTIERAFGTIERRWVQGMLPGWCANSSDERPEQLSRDIREGKLLTYEQFQAYFVNTILPEYHRLAGEDGESPMDIYARSERANGSAVPSWAVLTMAKENRAERRVGTTGIKWQGKVFSSPELAQHAGEAVTVLYNRRDDAYIGVMRGNEFLCIAEEAERLRLVNEDPDKLAEHLQRQRSAKRRDRAALQMPAERTRALMDMVMEVPDLDTAATITSAVHERAWRERQQAERRANAARGMKSAEDRRAETRIRDGLAEKGMALYRKAAEG